MRIIIFYLFIFSLGVQLSAQRSLSLQEAINLGLQSNDAMRLSELEVAVADAQIAEYKSIGMPKVNGSFSYQYYPIVPQQPVEDFLTPAIFGVLEGTGVLPPGSYVGPPDVFELSFFQPHNVRAEVSGNWLLFDGSYFVGLEAARLLKESTVQAKEVTEQQIANNITKAYLNVLLTDINREVLQNNLKNLENIRFESGEIYKAGFIEQLDLDRLDLSMMNIKSELEKLTNTHTLAKNILKFQIGLNIDDEILLTENIDDVVNSLKIDNIDLLAPLDPTVLPDFKQIEYGMQLQELNIKRFEKMKLPTLSLFSGISASLQRTNLFDNNEAGVLPSLNVGLSASIPIYDGNLRKSQVQGAQISYEKIKVQKDQFITAKQLELSNAKLQFQNAKRTLTNAENVLELTRKIYDKTRLKYQEGVGSSLEVAQAESDVYNAQATYINAIYQLVNAKTDIDIVLGNNFKK